MQLENIEGREVFVVYCWFRHSVTIVGVANSLKAAEKLRQRFIDEAPDPVWEQASRYRDNNTLIEPKFIEGEL